MRKPETLGRGSINDTQGRKADCARSPETHQQYRIAIANNNELLREGIACVIRREKEFSICGFAGDRKNILALVEQQKPDVLLLEFHIDDFDALDLVKGLTVVSPRTRIVVIGVSSKELYGERLLHAGAATYFPSRVTAEQLLGAIRRVAAPESTGTRDVQRTAPDNIGVSALTDRELHILCLIGRGHGTGDIARQLGLSRKTIEYYREQIKTKLDYRDASQLRKGAFEWARRIA